MGAVVTVPFRGTAREAGAAVARMVAVSVGAAPQRAGLHTEIRRAIGVHVLSHVQQQFLVKSRGGTDDSGLKWPPLSPKYLAYGRRFGPGEQKALKAAAGLGRKHNRGPQGVGHGVLSADLEKLWWKTYAKWKAVFLSQGEELKPAKGHAAAVAWNVVKAAGGKTKLQVYGDRKVEMLRDTGVLFASLSPSYEIEPGKVFKLLEGAVLVGTNVPYAAAHHYGKRPLWAPPDRWPDRVWENIAAAITAGMLTMWANEVRP